MSSTRRVIESARNQCATINGLNPNESRSVTIINYRLFDKTYVEFAIYEYLTFCRKDFNLI